MYSPLFATMVLLGYKVYAYHLDEESILSADCATYVSQIQAVTANAQELVRAAGADTSFFGMGNSMGSEVILYAAKHTSEIKSVYLNTVRGSVAEFIWHSSYGENFKPLYIRQGCDEAKTVKALYLIEAMNDVDLLGARPVLIAYSLADTIIDPENTQLLISALADARGNYRLITGKYLSHFGTSLLNFLTVARWHKFYKSTKA